MAELTPFEKLYLTPADSILPPTKEELLNRAKAESATAAPIRQGILPFLDRGLGTIISGAPSGASYLQEGLGKASSFLGFPEISSDFYEDAVKASEAGKELRGGGFFGAGVNPLINEKLLGNLPEEETFFTGLKVPSPGEMQDTNLLQNPITSKLMNEAAREDIDKLLQGSTPQTYDAFIEENKMGMAPPVGNPAAVREIEKVEAKKAIDDEAALNRREKALGDTNSGSTEDLFASAMEDFMTGVRGAGPDTPEQKTIDDYKKDFSKATGIDVSGKVDKSSALIAMGLSLMQNTAGSDFNAGKWLRSVGEAGEKALPALNKAKQTARQGVLAAGKYALQMESSDEAKRNIASEKAMDRGKYWVYKKGKPGAEFSSFDEGEFVDLNKYELNKLISNPEFDNQFEFIKDSDRFDILKVRADASDIELGDEWASAGYKPYSLIGGDIKNVPSELLVNAVLRDPNYKGKVTGNVAKIGEKAETIINRFISYQNAINRDVERFKKIGNYVDSGISIPKQVSSKITQFFRSIGFTPEEGMPSDIASAQQSLKNFSIDNATMILKESGKTLSDADRKLVDERVGKISFTNADPKLLHNQIADIYDFIVTKSQQNLDLAVKTLDRDFGIKVVAPPDVPTQEELDLINQQRKARGQAPRKMEEYQ
tara:strand:- start:5871 stop:7838 length:1968 start_codon:yes stop_codon:yes gene_type:complete